MRTASPFAVPVAVVPPLAAHPVRSPSPVTMVLPSRLATASVEHDDVSVVAAPLLQLLGREIDRLIGDGKIFVASDSVTVTVLDAERDKLRALLAKATT
jgi:hypothetical protein